MSILLFLIIILVFIVLIGIMNERYFHIQSDISLILFSFILSMVLLIASKLLQIESLDAFVAGLAQALMQGVCWPDCTVWAQRAAHSALLTPMTVNPDIASIMLTQCTMHNACEL